MKLVGMTLKNRTGPSGRTLLLSGLICLIVGISIVVARLHTPTPGVVIVAVIGVVAGFILTSTAILALFSRPIWIEGTVVDARWTISGTSSLMENSSCRLNRTGIIRRRQRISSTRCKPGTGRLAPA